MALKYALIGCGRVSPNHLRAARDNGFDIAAVCDIDDKQPLLAFKNAGFTPEETDGIKIYTSYTELLATEKPQLVSIATPSHLHAEIALAAIESGANVIIEKPVAMSLADADKIIAAAEQTGLKVAACHQNRFNKAVCQLRSAIDDGSLGDISHGSVTIRWSRDRDYYSSADWRGKWKSDGGALMNQCIHGIDLLRWCMGDELVAVSGVTRRRQHPYIEAEDVGVAVLEFASGAVATCEGSVNAYKYDMEEQLTVFGSKGTVKLGGTSANTIDYWCVEGQNDRGGFKENTSNVYGNGHTALFGDMADAIKNNRQPYVDIKAGRRALETVLAIYLASATGKRVELPRDDIASADFKGLFGDTI